MCRRLSFPTMIAMSAFLAAPALAQTMNSSPTSSPSTPPAGVTAPSSTSPAATPPMTPATPPMTRSTSAATGSASGSYVTADQQIRASKLIGSSVYNDQKEKIGSIDELLVDQHHAVISAVLSVGGFLGLGSKMVKVPYNELRVVGDEIVMSGATKDQLNQMPSYKFASQS
jgi:sporulation protein YlmC with PRC-barrel domain